MRHFLTSLFLLAGWMLPCMRLVMPPTASEDDMNRLQGRWKLIMQESNGRKISERMIRQHHQRLVIDRSRFIFEKDDKRDMEGSWQIEPSARPKRIMFDDVDPKFGGIQAVRAIYEFRGDSLVICIGKGGKPFPKKFATREGDGLRIEVYEREK